MSCLTLWIYLPILIISVIIGIPTTICGCDTYYPSCIIYNKVVKSLLYVEQIEETYQYCAVYSTLNKRTVCVRYESVNKWKNNLIFNGCIYNDAMKFDTLTEAIEYSEYNYANGTQLSLLQDKINPHICTIISGKPRNLAITGLFFLSLGAISTIIYTIYNLRIMNLNRFI